MPHPDIRRRPRPAAVAGVVTAAMMLAVAPATTVLGQTEYEIAQLCDTTPLEPIPSPTCEDVEEVLEPVVETAEPIAEAAEPVVEAAEPVVEAAEPVVEAAEPVVDAVQPVADALPDPITDTGGGGDSTGGITGTGGASSDGSGAGAVAAGSSHDEVSAAGTQPTEVAEPQGPANGRVTGPTIQPTVPGSTIAGIRSGHGSGGSGLTLQPYDAMPLVSIPTVLDSPQIAGAPVTTASPVAAVAAGAMDFAGDVVLPQTNAQAVMLTAFGVGLVAATGTTLRRRFTPTTITTTTTQF